MRRHPQAARHVLPPLTAALVAASLSAAGGASLVHAARAEEGAIPLPPPAVDEAAAPGTATEQAVLAGGCFWGVQGVFQHVKGVTGAVSGYAGGEAQTAQYEKVSTGKTGHAESVRITFDPHQISYGRILQIFFSVATDPTELDRQGPDVGTQYRSEIFTANAEQAKVATAYIRQLDAAHAFPGPIVTRVAPLEGFYPAEAYHQNFLALHPTYPYIAIFDLPKIANLERLFAADYRADPVLVNPQEAAR